MELAQDSFDGWDEFVRAQANASIYHLSGWREVLKRTYGIRTRYLSVRDGGRVVGILPLARIGAPVLGWKLVSLPYHMYGGLLAKGAEAAVRLVEGAVSAARAEGAGEVELRNVAPVGCGLLQRTDKVSLVLPLPEDPEELWKSFPAKVRNQCRKGEKEGLEFEVDPPDALDAFYSVMVVNMRDLGSPVHAREFFAAAREGFPRAGRVSVVRYRGATVAAGFTLAFKDKVEIPWASSLREYHRLCPNMFLYWNTLKDSIGRGVREFDFGRSTVNSGTHRFKQQWGGREVPLYYEYWTAKERDAAPSGTEGAAYRAASQVWRRLPLAVTRVLGPQIVRRIP